MADDLYKVLGVAKGARDDEIRRAYRRLAKELHPDVRPDDPVSSERFKLITAAYDILGDATQRRRYDDGEIDAQGEPVRTYARNGAGAGGGWPGGFGGGAGAGVGREPGVGDIFSDLFGRAARGAGPGFSVNLADVRVDRDTGKVDVIRFTAVQDVGKAIHPSYVEGQLQGGAAQGIGWALNEEYVYNADGVMENAGFLDYRMPVASDLPMIDTQIVEVPNPTHPYGVRGCGETPIVAPLAAVANAVRSATGVRIPELPLSPPRVLEAMDATRR